MEEREKILTKIQNLLALSNSGNVGEATNAMLLAQKLMLKHKIELAEVESQKDDPEIIEDTDFNIARNNWRRLLIKEIAINFYCDAYLHRGKPVIVGKSKDIEITKFMYSYCESELLRLFKDYMEKNYVIESCTRGFLSKQREQFAFGFIAGLKQKFKVQKEEMEKEFAVVLTNQEATDFIHKKNPNMGSKKINNPNEDPFAYLEGFTAGQTLSNPNAITD